jgi:hypothetical protein
MSQRLTLAAVLAAGVAAASTAFAADAAKDPLRVALQRSDMPASTQKSILPSPSRDNASDLAIIGRGLKGASYSYAWLAGGQVNLPGLGPADKEWHVSGEVFVAPTTAGARTLFQDGTRAEHGFFADFGTEGAVRLALPRYGDEQFGLLGKAAGGSGVAAAVFPS